jgi:hypothetical protein
MRRWVRGVLCVLVLPLGCVTTHTSFGPRTPATGAHRRANDAVTSSEPVGHAPPVPEPPPPLAHDARTVDVVVDEKAGLAAHLGAVLVHDPHTRGPGIVVVAGSGDVSREGKRKGDGLVSYQSAVPTSLLWAEALAARGARVLLVDKRTCGPHDDVVCQKNPQSDLDAQGPVALAKDVDAACELLRREPDVDGRIILWAHGQAAQVALSSSCAQGASALVLLAPIPRAIDLVLVDALRDREQKLREQAKGEHDATLQTPLLDQANSAKSAAATKEAGFLAMKAGKFSATSRIDGATLSFWRGWMELTAKTPTLLHDLHTPRVVVLGGHDSQYSEADRKRIVQLAGPGDVVVELPDADHHALVDEHVSPQSVDAIGHALDELLTRAGS